MSASLLNPWAYSNFRLCREALSVGHWGGEQCAWHKLQKNSEGSLETKIWAVKTSWPCLNVLQNFCYSFYCHLQQENNWKLTEINESSLGFCTSVFLQCFAQSWQIRSSDLWGRCHCCLSSWNSVPPSPTLHNNKSLLVKWKKKNPVSRCLCASDEVSDTANKTFISAVPACNLLMVMSAAWIYFNVVIREKWSHCYFISHNNYFICQDWEMKRWHFYWRKPVMFGWSSSPFSISFNDLMKSNAVTYIKSFVSAVWGGGVLTLHCASKWCRRAVSIAQTTSAWS